ncbi:MAG TPA: helix-turn-helix domain-containing protein [Mycobacteriales bacterium]|nr:helix-turn-helix domain-containing protein [Mycobacteriales bacterium]
MRGLISSAVPIASPVVDPTLRRLGTRVRRLREDRGLSVERLAELADLSVRGVLYLEHGRRDSRARTLLALAAALGVGIGELFVDEPAGGRDSAGAPPPRVDPVGP